MRWWFQTDLVCVCVFFFGRRGGDVFAAPTGQERKARAKEAQKRMCSLQGIADQRSTCNLHSSSKTEPCSLVRSNAQEARKPRPQLLKWSTTSATGDLFFFAVQDNLPEKKKSERYHVLLMATMIV